MPITLEQLTATKTVSVGGREFAIHRMKPLTVIAVTRRLAPLLTILKGMQSRAAEEAAQPDAAAAPSAPPPPAEQSFTNAMDRFGPLLDGLARLPEEDVSFVIESCLSTVQPLRQSAYPRVWSAETKGLADASYSSGDVMSLVGQVLFKVFEELMGDLPDIGLMGAAGG